MPLQASAVRSAHRVADYDAWRKIYDSVADMQKEGGGMTHESVHRMADDPDNVHAAWWLSG